jgi:hypothetical protein
MLLSIRELSASLNWEVEEEILHLLKVLVEGRDVLLLISKKYSYWELTFASNHYRSISMGRKRALTIPDSNRTDKSQLTQPAAEYNYCEGSIFFFRMNSSSIKCTSFNIFLSLSYGMRSHTTMHSTRGFSVCKRTVVASADRFLSELFLLMVAGYEKAFYVPIYLCSDLFSITFY